MIYDIYVCSEFFYKEYQSSGGIYCLSLLPNGTSDNGEWM